MPAYSPDMNIIENLWAILKRRIKEQIFEFGQPSAREDFFNLIENCWHSIPLEIIENLYLSLPKRMRLIVENDGNLTRY